MQQESNAAYNERRGMQQRNDYSSTQATAKQVYETMVKRGLDMPQYQKFLDMMGVNKEAADEDPLPLKQWSFPGNQLEAWQQDFNRQLSRQAFGKQLFNQFERKKNLGTDVQQDDDQYEAQQEKLRQLNNQQDTEKRKQLNKQLKLGALKQQKQIDSVIDKTVQLAQKEEKLSPNEQKIAKQIQQQLNTQTDLLRQTFLNDNNAQSAITKLNGALKSFTSNQLGYTTRVGKLLNALDPLGDTAKLVLINSLVNQNDKFMEFLAQKGFIDQIPTSKNDRFFALTSEGMGKRAKKHLTKLIAKKTPRAVAKIFQVLRQRILPPQDAFVNQKQIFKDLSKKTPAQFGLAKGLKQGAYLQSFPHWAKGQGKKAYRMLDTATKMDAYIQGYHNKNAPVYEDLGRLGSKNAHFNEQTGRWEGTIAQRYFQKAVNKANNLSKKLQKGKQIIGTNLSVQQLQKQVPTFVKNIVAANSNLSNYGFGPTTAKGPDMYAGRWLDQSTGRIRLLPTADSKYLNPGSRAQKLGYLQAKIINHWNQLITTNADYQRLLTVTDQKYAKGAIKSIQSGLQIKRNYVAFVNYINNVIQTYYASKSYSSMNLKLTPQMTAKQSLLAQVGGQKLRQIFDIIPQKVVLQKTKHSIVGMRKKISKWTQSMQAARLQLVRRVYNQKNITAQEELKLINSLNSAYLAFVGFIGRKVNTALNKARKIASISSSVTVPQLYGMQQQIKSQNSTFKQSVLGLVGSQIPFQSAATLTKLGTQIAANLRGGSFAAVLQKINKYKNNQQLAKGKTDIVPIKQRPLNPKRFSLIQDNFPLATKLPQYTMRRGLAQNQSYYTQRRAKQLKQQQQLQQYQNKLKAQAQIDKQAAIIRQRQIEQVTRLRGRQADAQRYQQQEMLARQRVQEQIDANAVRPTMANLAAQQAGILNQNPYLNEQVRQAPRSAGSQINPQVLDMLNQAA